MRRQAALTAATLIGVLLSVDVSIARTVKAFRIGEWSGVATIDDQTKRLSQCSAGSTNPRGISITYVVNDRYAWSLIFSNPIWNFSPGFLLSLTLTIGDQKFYNERALFSSQHALQVQLRDSLALFDTVRRGRMLQVQARGFGFDFDLNASDEVLASLVDCVDRHTARGRHAKASNRQLKRGKPVKSADVGHATEVAEATSMGSLLISHAQIGDVQLLGQHDISSIDNADFAWKANSVLATIDVLSSKDIATFDALGVRMVQQDSIKCPGSLFGGVAIERIDRTSVAKAITSCRTADGTTIKYYLGVARPSGGYYIFAASENELETIYRNQRAAKELTTKIGSVIMQMLSKVKPTGTSSE
jgi:hypothetical protein